MPQTLSADAKDALARSAPGAPHCRAALRDGLVVYGAGADGTFRTGRAAVARLLRSLLDDPERHAVRRVAGTRLRRLPTYEVDLSAVEATGTPPRARCDRRMELRAAFLACGSLSSPARGYHLEFVPPPAAAGRLAATLRAEGLHPKLATRGLRPRLYFKDSDEITRCLAAIGSSRALLHLEDVRALKETKNRIRRLVNTEAANVDRAAEAAAAQARSIALVADAYGLRNLRAPLREIAELRLQHPSETLVELGRRCSPPAGKSTVNGRIAALLRLAERLTSAHGAARTE